MKDDVRQRDVQINEQNSIKFSLRKGLEKQMKKMKYTVLATILNEHH